MNAVLLQKISWAAGILAAHAALIAAVLTPAPASGPVQRHSSSVSLSVLAVQLLVSAPTSPVLRAPVVVRPVASTVPRRNRMSDPPRPVIPHSDAEPEYLPSGAMDRRPTPLSAPDLESLPARSVSGLPVRLRLYIDHVGKVVRVVVLDASELDELFVAALAERFRATAFLPGRREGLDRASYMEIELLTS